MLISDMVWRNFSRWRSLCHFTQKSAASWWVHTQHLPGLSQQRSPVSVYSYFLWHIWSNFRRRKTNVNWNLNWKLTYCFDR